MRDNGDAIREALQKASESIGMKNRYESTHSDESAVFLIQGITNLAIKHLELLKTVGLGRI